MKTADPRTIIEASERLDLVYKVALAKAWADGSPEAVRTAEEAYLEMVRSRNGFYEDEPPRDNPQDFIDAFRATARSIRENGYDLSKPPIPLDEHGEVLNGAHRLAAAFAYSKTVAVETSSIYPAGGSVERTFLKGHIHPAVLLWGKKKYLEYFPSGRLAAAFEPVRNTPLIPFPDWQRRNFFSLRYKIKPFLSLVWCYISRIFRPTPKLSRRIVREKKKITGFSALARYWSKVEGQRSKVEGQR